MTRALHRVMAVALREIHGEPAAVAVEARGRARASVSRSVKGIMQPALRTSSGAKASGGSMVGMTRSEKPRISCFSMKASVGA